MVPDKNKVAQHKADLEKELVKALVDVDKEQTKINREDAKCWSFVLDTKIMEAHTCLGMCVSFHVPVLSYTYNKPGYVL